MILETSALIAILRDETEAEEFRKALARARRISISAANYLEAGIVLDRPRDPIVSRRLDQFIDEFGIEIISVTAADARYARDVYRDFGRGSGHPARLNFGDCFAYALSKTTGEPLLFKGDDFIHTDVEPALS